ncbi:cysteine--tRNA ligase, chloroplastic/mitochondrial-like isoform X3 [Olea europaea var. sylvestris]|uniref:cysteine--tRNA ligase, chloroplastic/mitochondrial-like isoform X3 n=1 Tax=Olea europaea var. sylvestris TaxID=158386 RepID=UPI000C1CFC08|nr:cysteine--tRNA ligase, chloroplastic/mitochondrial-like isoform X3 [Olea europaea var. sylvestris]
MATLLKCYKPLIPPIHRQTFKAKLLSSRANFRFCTLSSINCSNNSLPLTSNRERSTTVNDDNDSLIPMKKKELWLYNTMSRQKELFKPKVAAKVGMYVCGVTAYDLSHIGHARVYVSFDVMYRYLKYLGYEVNYVRNFTDVDDKIIARANELGEDPINLSRRYCEEFHCDMAYLHCLPPSIEPRVSDHIPEIIEMIKQSAKEGEPFWDSPWGPGRPGWHIECSAMSSTYLGYSFDIHGGGMDLIFPHHENEIAQSCAACHMSNVTYWIHNGFVTIDSEKMSKSLGNFFTIRQVLELYHPLALRLFLLGTHYRSPINYSEIQLESASDRIFYIYQTLHDCENILSQHDEASRKDSIPSGTALCIDKFNDEFLTSMSDDFHTPVTLAAMSEPLKTINDLLHTRKLCCSILLSNCKLRYTRVLLRPEWFSQGKKQELRIVSLAALENTIRNVLTLLGLFPGSYTEALQELRDYALKRARLTEDQVLQKIEERNKARKNKQYEESDAIRKYLSDVGIALMDSPEGTTWRPAIPLALQEQLVAAS